MRMMVYPLLKDIHYNSHSLGLFIVGNSGFHVINTSKHVRGAEGF